MKKAVTVAIAVAGMLGAAGAASAQTAQAAAAATQPAATPSRLDEVIARGTLRACTTGDYKPYSYYRDGGFEGIDIDMTESLAKSLGVKAEFVKTSWSNLLNDFVAKCDVAVGGVSTTLDRQKRAFFTDAYQVDGKTPIVRCTDVGKYQTVAQIDQPSTRVIVNPGGTNERFARQYFPHANLTVYPDNVTVFKQILAGNADVMVTDASETLLQQKLNPGLCAVHPEQPFQYGEKAWMVPRGDVVFQQYVDQWLHLARATGEYQTISDKWLK
ncbi:transporter substrate-binding domain-containing protein [Paraburkholderia caballeronis]|uniref:transporter substrate-binding domain-containing protein n=1 Tax=Paraburkholderia caballeronis TaxID=416943 RepID=UPI00106634E7|nr:transporter substrate-binding domain-containing protein [Paraburkholderia caballeronis]TDV11010.1 cyclohexadienyl dehydratase [Paraburkholderia caballeronis]TDV14300.1 cyclohexadienyl dehydratase [Paraburkholderia caballeronis]TDV23465.1 cyclohexadienyl dehydratase [Paraburkholderia caballeronis]